MCGFLDHIQVYVGSGSFPHEVVQFIQFGLIGEFLVRDLQRALSSSHNAKADTLYASRDGGGGEESTFGSFVYNEL